MGECPLIDLDARLDRHLQGWLGAWPPGPGLTLVASPERRRPGWDGRVRAFVGLETPDGTICSLPEEKIAPARALLEGAGAEGFFEGIGELVTGAPAVVARGVFRSSAVVSALPEAGEWVETTDPVVPEWLRPFNGAVLVALDGDGRYAAGVGRKRHDALGQELAVATEPEHRGRGLARRLVAQAARRVIEEGAVATYLHRPDNLASAAVAEAAGFPDRGWRILGLPTAS